MLYYGQNKSIEVSFNGRKERVESSDKWYTWLQALKAALVQNQVKEVAVKVAAPTPQKKNGRKDKLLLMCRKGE